MAQQQRAIQTRQVLLRAAAEVFGEFGYEATSMAEILRRTELTKGALYFHFNSKDELALGVLEEAVTTEGVAPQTLKLQEWIDTLLILAYRLPRDPVLSAALKLSVDVRARERFGTQWPDWMQLLTAGLEEADQAGELLPDVDRREVARIVMSSWTGVQVVLEAVPSGNPLVDHVASLLDLVLPSIAVPAILRKLDTAPMRAERAMAGPSMMAA